MNETTLLQLVALTIAVVEGIKQFGLSQKWLTLVTVVVGAVLAAVAEFAPEVWVRIMPMLMVGLAAAGLYSIGKRVGNTVLNNNKK